LIIDISAYDFDHVLSKIVTGALQVGGTSEELSGEREPGTGIGSTKGKVQSSKPHTSM
jgi:hypothetical protein